MNLINFVSKKEEMNAEPLPTKQRHFHHDFYFYLNFT